MLALRAMRGTERARDKDGAHRMHKVGSSASSKKTHGSVSRSSVKQVRAAVVRWLWAHALLFLAALVRGLCALAGCQRRGWRRCSRGC